MRKLLCIDGDGTVRWWPTREVIAESELAKHDERLSKATAASHLLRRQAPGGNPYSRRNARLKAVSVW